MPNCYQLIDKLTDEIVPLTEVDSMLCKHFGVKEHDRDWFCNWNNRIGLDLAMGKTLDSLRQEYPTKDWYKDHEDLETLLKIIDFLEEKFYAHAWVTRGK